MADAPHLSPPMVSTLRALAADGEVLLEDVDARTVKALEIRGLAKAEVMDLVITPKGRELAKTYSPKGAVAPNPLWRPVIRVDLARPGEDRAEHTVLPPAVVDRRPGDRPRPAEGGGEPPALDPVPASIPGPTNGCLTQAAYEHLRGEIEARYQQDLEALERVFTISQAVAK